MAETAKTLDTAQQPAQLSDALNKKRVENAHSWFKWWIDTEGREFTSAARTLGLSDAEYRAILRHHGGVGSAAAEHVISITELQIDTIQKINPGEEAGAIQILKRNLADYLAAREKGRA